MTGIKIITRSKPREDGMVDLKNSGHYENGRSVEKPRFIVKTLQDKLTKNNLSFTFLSTDRTYSQELLRYLNMVYRRLREDIGEENFSLRINPPLFSRLQEISEQTDIIFPENLRESIILNENKNMCSFRNNELERLVRANENIAREGLSYIISTKQNTSQDAPNLMPNLIVPIFYRPVCNHSVPLGLNVMKKTRERDPKRNIKFTLFWEMPTTTPEFIKYLIDVHELITGHPPEEGETLQISCPKKDTEDEKIVDEIQYLEKYKNEKVTSRFMHAEIELKSTKEGPKYFLSHLDGSIFTYDFNKLRKRLFWMINPSSWVNDHAGEYKKVFRLDINNENTIPLYNSIITPDQFDIHDLIDLFFTRICP